MNFSLFHNKLLNLIFHFTSHLLFFLICFYKKTFIKKYKHLLKLKFSVRKIKFINFEFTIKMSNPIKKNIKNRLNDLFNYERDTFNVIESYIKERGNNLHIDSYHKFMDETLQQIIDQFNTIEINHGFETSVNKYKTTAEIDFLDYFIEEPIIYENNGSYKKITPAIARLRNLSYSAPLYINIKIKIIKRSGEFLENEEIEEEKFTKVNFG